MLLFPSRRQLPLRSRRPNISNYKHKTTPSSTSSPALMQPTPLANPRYHRQSCCYLPFRLAGRRRLSLVARRGKRASFANLTLVNTTPGPIPSPVTRVDAHINADPNADATSLFTSGPSYAHFLQRLGTLPLCVLIPVNRLHSACLACALLSVFYS
ncbi:hypothetical protein GALMADRAFT_628184 [Galerina marginata CBS 339.88]|uniref:Uncharacterized protein n=1 Tax=Galerina marginata (strain CBS 339.88) TaxID=685588 RepID=A0A067SUF1_GALM3|nr:hypothetical protein GALMADRAFT_628184 [Galerina marginata CBS 339.88]